MSTDEIKDCPTCHKPIVCGSAVEGLNCECSLAAPAGSAARPNFKRCKCGNLIVLAHGEDECAVCYMKRMGLWDDPIEELRRKYSKPPNAELTDRRQNETGM